MTRKTQSSRFRQEQKRRNFERRKNKTNFIPLVRWLIPDCELFTEDRFHGNIKWKPEQIAQQALIWSWQEARFVTDAFTITAEHCRDLGISKCAKTYTGFMDALGRYHKIFSQRLWQKFRSLAQEVGGRFWRNGKWALIGFDGSRASTPRTVSNEEEFCAQNYGNGKTAKYRKKKTKNQRRQNNEKNKPEPQGPQTWITMMWHMGLRLPWSWRLGPSNSSERAHVAEMLEQEEFPENTLFCGDAGFVGYPLWNTILAKGGDLLVRVGGNVKLLTEQADVEQLAGGIVLCWPKDKMKSGDPPLRLRLVQIKIGKTKMWMLTSVLDRKQLPKKKIAAFYKMRWGIEVEFRGLKETLDKRDLRCRNSERAYVELDWSIRAMAMAELLALREQIPDSEKNRTGAKPKYDTKHRSLANTVRALRECMRRLLRYAEAGADLLSKLADALVQQYNNRTDKKARYRPKNPDKKPLGEPTVKTLDPQQRERLRKLRQENVV